MNPQKNLAVYDMLVSLIKAEEDSIAQIRAMEDEVWLVGNNFVPRKECTLSLKPSSPYYGIIVLLG